MPVRTLALATLLAVLGASSAAANDPIEPLGTSPLYQLSNFRTERDQLGRLQLAIDFKRTRKGEGSIFVKGKSARGILSIAAPVSTFRDSGTIRLTSLSPGGGDPQQLDIELYLVQFLSWGDFGVRYAMVSNPVRLGNPGEATKPRLWTEEEKRAHANHLKVMADDKAQKPRKSYAVSIDVPEDSAVVPPDARLVPGTKLQACYANKWNPLTTLSENPDGSINVRWDDYGAKYDCSMVRDELIIEKEVLAQLGRFPINPFAFRTPRSGSGAAVADRSMPKPKKSYPVTIAVPEDSLPVPADANLPPGTKLQACYANKWNPITLLWDNPDGTLTIRWDDYGASFDCAMARSELIVAKAVLAESQMTKVKAGAPQAQSRTWTDATGEFTVQAKLVGKTAAKVFLAADDGKQVAIALKDLSEADRRFVTSAPYQ